MKKKERPLLRWDASPAAYRKKVRRLYGLALVWFALLVVMAVAFESSLGMTVLVVLAIPLLAVLWRLKCPCCGAPVVQQEAFYNFAHLRCRYCGFQADGEEPET